MKFFIIFIIVLTFFSIFGCNNAKNINKNDNQIYFGAFNDKKYIWTEYQFTVNSNSVNRLQK